MLQTRQTFHFGQPLSFLQTFLLPVLLPALLAVLVLVPCLTAMALHPEACLAAACAATGSAEVTEADVHEARLRAKADTLDFSSGALDAAKECAELLNRISSMRLGAVGIPTGAEILEALRSAAGGIGQDTVDEACRYVATTSGNWVRSQVSQVRAAANATASELVHANVQVTNPNLRALAATYRSRLRQGLPTYHDLPSLQLPD